MNVKEKSSFITNWVLIFVVIGIIDAIIMNFVNMSDEVFSIMSAFTYIYIVLAVNTLLTLISSVIPSKDQELFGD